MSELATEREEQPDEQHGNGDQGPEHAQPEHQENRANEPKWLLSCRAERRDFVDVAAIFDESETWVFAVDTAEQMCRYGKKIRAAADESADGQPAIVRLHVREVKDLDIGS